MSARFDDLVTGRALAFPAPQRVVAAERVDDVVGVLAEVQRATDAGQWAYGCVGYEAAPAFDSAMVAHERTPFGMPLAWFGLGAAPIEVAPVAPVDDDHVLPAWNPGWTVDDHARRVAAVRERIRVGDCYQVNLTERLTATVDDPAALHRDLALAQRGAYHAWVDLGSWTIASASPELFFEWRGDQLLTRPMKGTARRGRFVGEDRESAERLRCSAKERAENVMIVDLLRNDLSRVAIPGTVEVPSLFAVERYPTVLQLTSDVVAQLRPGVGLVDLFGALFPCGSVTGAPKISAMSIIAGLEAEPRGVYCGAIGYVAPPGEAVRSCFSVAIRTAVIETATGRAVYGTGGGITWDSDPAAEQAELVVKAAVLSVRLETFALLETLRYEPGSGLQNGDRHLRRLAASAEHLGFRCDLALVRARLDDALRNAGPSRVRIVLARDGEVRVELGPLPADLGRPVRLALDRDPIDPTDWRWFHKITRREPYEVRAVRHPDADDVIMINTRGELTETTRASLVLHLDGRWWTPTLTSGCLPGIERERLLDSGELTERVLTVDDLSAADGLAVVSSLRGWRPATLLAISSRKWSPGRLATP